MEPLRSSFGSNWGCEQPLSVTDLFPGPAFSRLWPSPWKQRMIPGVINGVHAIVFSPQAEQVRAFFADVLGLPSADAGGGWLIFALPPAELAVHPADGGAATSCT